MTNQDDQYSNKTRMAPFYVIPSDLNTRVEWDKSRSEHDWRCEFIVLSQQLAERDPEAVIEVKAGYSTHTRWKVTVPVTKDTQAYTLPGKSDNIFTRIHAKDIPFYVVKHMVFKLRYLLKDK